MNAQVDSFFEQAQTRKDELILLRSIILQAEMQEEFKWKAPCYTFQKKNVCMIFSFKSSFGLSFFKGAFISDSYEILEKPGDNTQNIRLIRFTNREDVNKKKQAILNYINQALELEKMGVKMVKNTESKFECIEELEIAFGKNPKLKVAFESLTPGRQRAYHMFFAAAKHTDTRFSRIHKFTDQIIDGKGMNDCTCGLSQKMPICDGAHKILKQIKTT